MRFFSAACGLLFVACIPCCSLAQTAIGLSAPFLEDMIFLPEWRLPVRMQRDCLTSRKTAAASIYRFFKKDRTLVDGLRLRNGRGGGIRTPGPLLPKQMRYQAALRPDS